MTEVDPSEQAQSTDQKSTGLQKSTGGPLSIDDSEFPPFDSNKSATDRHSEPSKKQASDHCDDIEEVNQVELPSVDDLLASKLRQSSVKGKQGAKEHHT